MKIAGFLACALSAMLPHQVRAQTIADYLAIEQGEFVGIDSGANEVLVWGVLEGITAFAEVAALNDVIFFCTPDEGGLIRPEQFKKQIDRYLADLKRQREDFATYAQNVTLGYVGLEVMVGLFPCEDEN